MIDNINFSIDCIGNEPQDPRAGSWRGSPRLSVYRKKIEEERIKNPGKKPEGYDDLLYRHMNI